MRKGNVTIREESFLSHAAQTGSKPSNVIVVRYRIKDGRVIALFPEIPDGDKVCYLDGLQVKSGNYSYIISTTREARPFESKHMEYFLRQELGYIPMYTYNVQTKPGLR